MEENFEELFNQSVKDVNIGKTVTGTVIKITQNKEIYVDLGYKADGIIPLSEYSYEEDKNPSDEFKPGDKITADVLKMNDGIGNVLLSYKKAKVRDAWKNFEQKVNNKEIFTGKVTEVNNNGLIVIIDGIRVFIPMSLSCINRNEDIQSYKGKEVQFIITEYNKENKKIIGSIKEIKDKEKRMLEDKFWNEVEVGKTYEGTVVAISNYGAFVELEKGIQGLLHVSEMSWEKNVNVHDILKENQKINVSIKELDKENRRLKLSTDLKGEDPWNIVKEKYNVNDVVKVKIVKFMTFGAFAELEKGIEGLIHISQISGERITKPEEKLKIGQEVNAKIIDIDLENKKIGLSISELEGTSYDLEYQEELKNLK
jgi:4-hydroxy-3-methylbut-2-enyl diphosphate reductase